MNNLRPEKVTFMIKGSNNNKLIKIMEDVYNKHDTFITKTDLINIAVDVFFKTIEENAENIEDYLIKYNKL